MNLTQDVVSAWLVDRFGPERDLHGQVRKFYEEVLEMNEAYHGITKHPDAIEEPSEGWDQNFKDEVADVAIVCFGLAITQGFDLQEAISDKWSRRKMGPPKDGET